MAVNYFLKLDGITGDSTDAQHKGQLQILSWSWGASNSVSATGSSAGKANLADLNLMLSMDSSIPSLFKDLASGVHLASATLSSVKSGAAPFTFLTLTLSEVFIVSLQLSASSDIPSVTLSLAYKSIQMQYTPQNSAGGSGTSTTTGWDLTRNAAI